MVYLDRAAEWTTRLVPTPACRLPKWVTLSLELNVEHIRLYGQSEGMLKGQDSICLLE